MKIRSTTRTDATLAELGDRIRRHRLDRNQTQAELATEAGIGEATLRRMEAGESPTLTNLIRVLRALDHLSGLDAVLPEPTVSPIELARRAGRTRQRASGRSEAEPESGDA
ncbi:MAG: helix-turn-helix transcriptional regulator [Longimicrobiales bacterium]|nr:helix-turn-helix transcriptional regulator [Longimicrobiales bacterium]